MIRSLLVFPYLLCSLVAASQSLPRSIEAKVDSTSCPMTLPRKSPLQDFRGSNVYWEGRLFVAGLTPDGTMRFSPDKVSPDGSLAQKFGWYRAECRHGRLP